MNELYTLYPFKFAAKYAEYIRYNVDRTYHSGCKQYILDIETDNDLTFITDITSHGEEYLKNFCNRSIILISITIDPYSVFKNYPSLTQTTHIHTHICYTNARNVHFHNNYSFFITSHTTEIYNNTVTVSLDRVYYDTNKISDNLSKFINKDRELLVNNLIATTYLELTKEYVDYHNNVFDTVLNPFLKKEGSVLYNALVRAIYDNNTDTFDKCEDVFTYLKVIENHINNICDEYHKLINNGNTIPKDFFASEHIHSDIKGFRLHILTILDKVNNTIPNMVSTLGIGIDDLAILATNFLIKLEFINDTFTSIDNFLGDKEDYKALAVHGFDLLSLIMACWLRTLIKNRSNS